MNKLCDTCWKLFCGATDNYFPASDRVACEEKYGDDWLHDKGPPEFALTSHELRLLQPVSISNQVLRFKTRRVQRASIVHTPYTAVSYTWGNQEASEIIYLDDRRFHVRPNLWSCLYYMARAAQNYLWVDAICIDQTDDAEKSSQVQLMDQTYRDAVSVSVWLGLIPVSEDLESLPTRIRTLESDGFDWIDSLAELSSRPYWSRIWVIQEFLLGKNVELVCSDNRIDWVDFQGLLADKEKGLPALPLVMGRHRDKHPEYLQPLCDLLIDHRKAQCHDQRDRVFGLLGLITIEQRMFLGIYCPDYGVSEDHVRIITLAHLTQFAAESRMSKKGEDMNVDSEEVFLGLGVEEKSKRRRLLRRARRIDYLGGMSRQEMMLILADQDQDEEIELWHADEEQEMHYIEVPTTPRDIWLYNIFIIGFTLFVVWYIARTAMG